MLAGCATAGRNEASGHLPPASHLRQTEGRPAGRILLGLMMPFDDGDIGRLAQRARSRVDKLHQQIDSTAHIRGDQDRNTRRRRFQLASLVRGEAGRADDQRDLPRFTALGRVDRRPGSEKSIMTSIATVAGRLWQTETPAGAKPDHHVGILAEMRIALAHKCRAELQVAGPGR